MTKTITTKEEVQKFRIAFGPGATYFARSLKELKWNDLPKALEKEMAAWTKSKGSDYLPTSVTFGLNNAWVAMWPDNMYRFDFAGQYVEAEKRITSSTTVASKRLKVCLSWLCADSIIISDPFSIIKEVQHMLIAHTLLVCRARHLHKKSTLFPVREWLSIP